MKNYSSTKEEIQEVVDEFYNEHTVHGTENEPVVITERTAELILRSRKRREEWLNSIDETHEMNDWESEIRAPDGTPRFYSVRQCERCEHEQSEHPAGRFMDLELTRRCPELPPIEKDYDI